MRNYADELQALGRRSDNAIWEDLANLSAQYRRAFIQALTTYVPADNYLAGVSAQLAFAINDAVPGSWKLSCGRLQKPQGSVCRSDDRAGAAWPAIDEDLLRDVQTTSESYSTAS